jgi:signal transduction histidine kinase
MFVSTRPGGTGLGLAMARTAVENSGGTIGVGSASGGGARFTIRLRLAPAGRVWSGAGGGESQSGEARG